jgi:hypothetical protein
VDVMVLVNIVLGCVGGFETAHCCRPALEVIFRVVKVVRWWCEKKDRVFAMHSIEFRLKLAIKKSRVFATHSTFD